MHHLQHFQSGIAGQATLAFLSAFVVTTPLVLLTIEVCKKRGWVSKPRSDRWHKGTPAFFGGVPLFTGFITLSTILLPWSNHLLWRLLGITSLMFIIGLVDDIHRLSPAGKLAAQLTAAFLLVLSGVVYPLRDNLIVNIIASILWLVGITNAFNLLDNMDGLSAGVALISAGYLVVFYVSGGHRDQAVIVALAAGAIAGFLVYNFNPARIFMGDCGSLFIGFLLGATSLLDVTHMSGVPAFVLAPATVLAIPIFDTVFVSVTRRLRGQAISQGGTDHSSHRLVRLGLEERRAVLLLYVLSAGSGAVALLTRRSSSSGASGLIAFWFFFLLLFGIHLFHDEPTYEASPARPLAPLLDRVLSRDTLVFLLDPLAMLLSYYLAYAMRFAGHIPPGDKLLLLHSIAIVVGIKILSSWVCRAFRHSWWRGSVSDIYRLGAAIALGESLSVLAVTVFYRFSGFSRAVFVIDALITWLLVLAIRRSFPLFQETIWTWQEADRKHRRVFILGTSSQAELALRFLRDQHIECAGFIDTNGGADIRRYVFGRPVLGRLDELSRLSQKYGIAEVVLPDSEDIHLTRVDLTAYCRDRELRLTRLGLYESNEDSPSHHRVATA